MSIESRCTIGAMASKKASASSPVSLRMAAARAGEVSGPVAMMTLSQSGGGSATSPRSSVISGWASSAADTAAGKAVAVDRERAAGRHLVGVGGAHDQRAEPAHLLVQQADGVVLRVVGAERVGADQFGIAVGLVRGGRDRSGRISCSTTGTPACASCQAASEPARPPPTMWTGCMAGQAMGRAWSRQPPKRKRPRRVAGGFDGRG